MQGLPGQWETRRVREGEREGGTLVPERRGRVGPWFLSGEGGWDPDS